MKFRLPYYSSVMNFRIHLKICLHPQWGTLEQCALNLKGASPHTHNGGPWLITEFHVYTISSVRIPPFQKIQKIPLNLVKFRQKSTQFCILNS